MVLLSVTACSVAPNSTTPLSTLAHDSPWLGDFASVDPPAPVNSLSALDCASVSRCWAVGATVGLNGAPNGAAVIATTNGGTTWKNEVIPPSVASLSGIACTNKDHCVAVGQSNQSFGGQAIAIATTDGGRVWAQVPTPAAMLDIVAVSCLANGHCISVGTTAMGSAALISTSSGQTWQQVGALPPSMSGTSNISCTDELDCWVTGHAAVASGQVAGAMAVTADGGTTWTAVTLPAGIGYLSGISCVAQAPTGKGAAGAPALTAPPTLPTSSSSPTSSSAPTASSVPTSSSVPTASSSPTTSSTLSPTAGEPDVTCTAVGSTANTLEATRSGHGVILTSDDGGATWTSENVNTLSASLTGVSCPAVGECVAVGSSVALAPQAGQIIATGRAASPWKSPTTLSAPQALTAVSCTSISSCVIVGESIIESLVGG
jgi:photosystem II stability/assembly factor-like uncharacterized protein